MSFPRVIISFPRHNAAFQLVDYLRSIFRYLWKDRAEGCLWWLGKGKPEATMTSELSLKFGLEHPRASTTTPCTCACIEFNWQQLIWWMLPKTRIYDQRKKKEIWLRPMSKAPALRKIQKATWQHKNVTKNFNYTTITDRLRTVSWGNDIHPTDVVKPVCWIPTFPLTAKAV